MIETLLLVIMGSNQQYALWRSFPESFEKNQLLFFTLLMASTWLDTLK
jgi:hypothetical protein